MLVGGLLRLVDVRDEVADAAGGEELLALVALALVDEDDPQALGQERRLAEALHEPFAVPLGLLEDLGVGLEADRRAGVLRRPDRLHLRGRLAACELLAPGLAVALHLRDQPLGERVHDRDADAVQAAGDLVAALPELAAGVELGQDDRQRRQPLVLHHVDRDARAVVLDGHRLVRMDRHLEQVAPSRERLVDRVRDHLVGEVMEAPGPRRADVHPGPFPDRIESFEDSDVLCGVGGFSQRFRCDDSGASENTKALQMSYFRAEYIVSEREVGRGRSKGPEQAALSTLFRSSSSSIPAASSAARCRASGVGSGTGVRASSGLGGGGSGRWPTANRNAFGALSPSRSDELRGDLRSELPELECPRRRRGVHVQRPVARDPRRPGVRGDHRPDRLRPGLDQLRHPALRAEPARAPA